MWRLECSLFIQVFFYAVLFFKKIERESISLLPQESRESVRWALWIQWLLFRAKLGSSREPLKKAWPNWVFFIYLYFCKGNQLFGSLSAQHRIQTGSQVSPTSSSIPNRARLGSAQYKGSIRAWLCLSQLGSNFGKPSSSRLLAIATNIYFRLQVHTLRTWISRGITCHNLAQLP